MQMKTKYVLTIAFIASVFYIAKTIMKGGENMVAIYVALIIYKRRTIETVPAQLRDAVSADLTALGLDGNGDPIPQP